MVKYGSMDLSQALETVKEKRQKVIPNEGKIFIWYERSHKLEGMLEQVRSFESGLRVENVSS